MSKTYQEWLIYYQNSYYMLININLNYMQCTTMLKNAYSTQKTVDGSIVEWLLVA